jgi:hypothetical protein
VTFSSTARRASLVADPEVDSKERHRMTTTFQLRSGARPIGLREAATPHEALFDYVRSLGCRDEEIMRLGTHALSWRGAVYRAVPVPRDAREHRRPG